MQLTILNKDVDTIYMNAVQSLGISGGWPLNVFYRLLFHLLILSFISLPRFLWPQIWSRSMQGMSSWDTYHKKKPRTQFLNFFRTYFPKPSFLNVLARLNVAWRTERAKVLEAGELLFTNLNTTANQLYGKGEIPINESLLQKCYAKSKGTVLYLY